MTRIPRVAYFPDTFLEVDGLAMTSNKLIGYAKKNGYPFLCIHAGGKNEETKDGSVEFLSLKRSPVAIPMDDKLRYDPFFQRHTNKVLKKLMDFQPDILHITGLNDVSIMGSYLAWKLKMPLIGSWHTNLHKFAASRLNRMFGFLPDPLLNKVTGLAERKIMDGSILYYKMPKVLLAPNQDLMDKLKEGTKRDVFLMTRGVDTEKFSPQKRTVSDGTVRLGFIGRLRAEKNVRLLEKLEKEIINKTDRKFEFLIVGDGNEREWLEKNMKKATFTGFLEGEKLAEAYANMDIFVFPSKTDTFGNVVQEANASGVPALVTDQGGPQFIVRNGKTGYICKNIEDFTNYSLELMDNREKLLKMKEASREFALSQSWDSVFDSVYKTYNECIRQRKAGQKKNAATNKK
jgi:glycosyltransferase involved in cell wall biosynthesis